MKRKILKVFWVIFLIIVGTKPNQIKREMKKLLSILMLVGFFACSQKSQDSQEMQSIKQASLDTFYAVRDRQISIMKDLNSLGAIGEAKNSELEIAEINKSIKELEDQGYKKSRE